jgi:anti-sigma factor RsiW
MMRAEAGKSDSVLGRENVRARTPALQPVWRLAVHWVAMMRKLAIVALLLGSVAGSRPQQLGGNQNANAPQNFTIKVQSNLVVEAVEVKDKEGHFVQGLTAKDFVLTEDGAPQTIKFCEHQNLSETAKPLPPMTSTNENVTIYDKPALQG